MHRGVGTNYYSVPTGPSLALNPIRGAEKRIRSAIAGVDGVDALYAVVIISVKERHQERLCRLPSVYGTLRADFEPPDLRELEFALSEQSRQTRHRHRDCVLVIAHKGNTLLAASYCVSTGALMECFGTRGSHG